MRRLIAFATALPLLAAAPAPRSHDVFAQPQAYLGKEVTVCGYMIGISNLSEAPIIGDKAGPGLSVNGQAEALRRRTREGEGRFCLQGVIKYVGCAGGPCLEWMYDYLIDVRRIVS